MNDSIIQPCLSRVVGATRIRYAIVLLLELLYTMHWMSCYSEPAISHHYDKKVIIHFKINDEKTNVNVYR